MKAVLFKHIFALIFSFLLALYIIPLIIKAAYRLRFLDKPDGEVKVHEKATPYLGGFGVFIPFIITLGLIYPFQNDSMWLLLGSTLLLCIGLVDDLKVLVHWQKFLGQFFAVACFLKGGFSLRTDFFSGYYNIVFSAFWMLSVINAFNLVDVMDGLSSLLALIAATSFCMLALWLKQYTLSLLLLAFIGPLFAFFLFNKPPAKIYLGDTGSLFVGGFLSAVPMLLGWSSIHVDGKFAPLIILGVPLLMLGIPLLEILSLVIIRTSKGIPFYCASPHHFSIYLRKKKWSVPIILAFSGLSSAMLSLIAFLLLLNIIELWHAILSIIAFCAVWLYAVFYGRNDVVLKEKME
jgi:UDP-GlcNAc:undecaprenyl-phosphate GlcNAc-1-phosphate transferase